MLTPKSLRGKVRWSAALVVAVKARIKTELDLLRDAEGPAATLRHILAEIGRREETLDPQALLERLVYVVSAIFHHSRYDGLPRARERSLVELAYGILQVQGIRPGTSTLSGLYGELHLALGHSRRQRGEHWKAAWEQHLGTMLARSSPPGGKGFPLLSGGLRALRLGHGPDATQSFDAAERKGLDAQPLALARLSAVLALRLAGELEAAASLAAATTGREALAPRMRQEFAWEALCRELAQSGDFAPLLAATRPDGSHFKTVFVLEAFLWSLCLKTTTWTARLPRIARLPRRTGLTVSATEPFFVLTRTLEACYDEAVPLVLRLKALGDALDDTGSLVSIDKELLVLGAAARWLSRTGNLALAALVLSRYRSLSRDLSDGLRDDALGILGDLIGRDWYQRRGNDAA